MLPTAESLIFAPGLLQRPGAQSVEKPGCPLSGGRASDVYGAEKAEKRETGAVVPFPYGQLFQVHGSKLKLHPVCDLSQASVLRITHRVFFLGVREDPFNGLFSPLVKIPVLRRISGVVRQFLIVLPDMPLHRFDTVLGMRTPFSGRTGGADIRITLVFPISITVQRYSLCPTKAP